MPLARKLFGIGIDLVSRSRIQRFLASHSRKSLRRLFTPSEQIAFGKTSHPVEFFARSFAAKEAYFKASGGIFLREEDFRETEVVMEGEREFCIAKAGVPDPLRGEGRFFETPEGIGAQVLIWKGRDL